MFRRMAIMLVLVAAAFAAIFGFQAFKARMIDKVIAGLRNPPQTVSTIIAAALDANVVPVAVYFGGCNPGGFVHSSSLAALSA